MLFLLNGASGWRAEVVGKSHALHGSQPDGDHALSGQLLDRVIYPWNMRL